MDTNPVSPTHLAKILSQSMSYLLIQLIVSCMQTRKTNAACYFLFMEHTFKFWDLYMYAEVSQEVNQVEKDRGGWVKRGGDLERERAGRRQVL